MSHRETIKAVILAGGSDFGRCRLAASLPTALWPVAGRPVLERLLVSLADQGLSRAVVCSNGGNSLLAESIRPDGRLKVEFVEDTLPVGTAGAIRNTGRGDKDALHIVFPAGMVSPPKVDELLEAHRRGRCELTVMFNPGNGNQETMGEACGIYVCQGDVLEHIPKDGYFDVKEGLVREMVRVGKAVHAAVLGAHAGNFRNRPEYLRAVADYLECVEKPTTDVGPCEQQGSQSVWIAAGATVHSTAKICEPVIIMDGADISEGVVILGPTVVGSKVSIDRDAVVAGSVIWDGARLGPSCMVQRCLVGRGAVVRRNRVVQDAKVV